MVHIKQDEPHNNEVVLCQGAISLRVVGHRGSIDLRGGAYHIYEGHQFEDHRVRPVRAASVGSLLSHKCVLFAAANDSLSGLVSALHKSDFEEEEYEEDVEHPIHGS